MFKRIEMHQDGFEAVFAFTMKQLVLELQSMNISLN